ncbi:Hypothetical protein DEACI_1025 [Acididesulfobacillus acetoxydans]|uniref:Uncharacterized protein n=1 Tax=Acididesulfobacillus acetoxydans TaxID=1561005 RepID=A0A8S0WER2_9FIRM|nr:Hypothetical protein DEACI_1025 [Acididesulfobacillus acetoxydans]CEJ07894.1 Hypothetical protein DEACI_2362 [Acididesulfobacillus acetoxydans]
MAASAEEGEKEGGEEGDGEEEEGDGEEEEGDGEEEEGDGEEEEGDGEEEEGDGEEEEGDGEEEDGDGEEEDGDGEEEDGDGEEEDGDEEEGGALGGLAVLSFGAWLGTLRFGFLPCGQITGKLFGLARAWGKEATPKLFWYKISSSR